MPKNVWRYRAIKRRRKNQSKRFDPFFFFFFGVYLYMRFINLRTTPIFRESLVTFTNIYLFQHLFQYVSEMFILSAVTFLYHVSYHFHLKEKENKFNFIYSKYRLQSDRMATLYLHFRIYDTTSYRQIP